MKNSQASKSPNNANDDLLPEYNFDYRKALPNRFASQDKKAPLIRLSALHCVICVDFQNPPDNR